MFAEFEKLITELRDLIKQIHQAIVPAQNNTPPQPSEVLNVAPEIDASTAVEPTTPSDTSVSTEAPAITDTPGDVTPDVPAAEAPEDPTPPPVEKAPSTGVLDPSTTVAPTEATA
jgi:hypothetical protein